MAACVAVVRGEALRGVLAAVLDLPVRRGLVDFLVQKAVEAAATAAVGLDCCSASAGAAVILEHESLLARAGEVLHGGKKATKEDVRTALAKAGRADLCKRLEVQTRGRRAAAHPDPGLCRQVLSAIRPVQAKQKEPQEAVIVDRATAKPEEFGEETKEQEQGQAEQVPATTASQTTVGTTAVATTASPAMAWGKLDEACATAAANTASPAMTWGKLDEAAAHAEPRATACRAQGPQQKETEQLQQQAQQQASAVGEQPVPATGTAKLVVFPMAAHNGNEVKHEVMDAKLTCPVGHLLQVSKAWDGNHFCTYCKRAVPDNIEIIECTHCHWCI